MGEHAGLHARLCAVRSVTEQWGAHPVTDPLVVKTLQDVYRQAVGLPPLPDPILLGQSPKKAAASNDTDAPTEADREPEAIASDQNADELKLSAEPIAPGKKSKEEPGSALPYDGSPLARCATKSKFPSAGSTSAANATCPKTPASSATTATPTSGSWPTRLTI